MAKRVQFRMLGLGTACCTFPDTLLSGQFEDDSRFDRPFNVIGVRIFSEGIIFEVTEDDGTPLWPLRVPIFRFPAFLNDMTRLGLIENIETLHTIPHAEAMKFIPRFQNWLTIVLAQQFELEIKAGNMTFEEARKFRKDVFSVPSFRCHYEECFASGKMPKGKKGKRRIHSPNIENLYALANRIHKEDPTLSFEAACWDAVEQRPDLVPDSWKIDPGGNLKREASRFWDKSPYSQLTFRQNRDR